MACKKIVFLSLCLLFYSAAFSAYHYVDGQNGADRTLMPAYLWYAGCMPTSMAMVVAYWDNYGATGSGTYGKNINYGKLVDYYLDKTAMTSLLNRWGTSYNWPNEESPRPKLIHDLAVAMDTSALGGTAYNASGITIVAQARGYKDPELWSNFYIGSAANDWLWPVMTNEINNNRPFVYGATALFTGHALAVWGYTDDKYLIVYNTWDEMRHDYYYMYYNGVTGTVITSASVTTVEPQGGMDSDCELTWPDGGEYLLTGSTYDIEWIQYGDGINTVRIFSSYNGGLNWTLLANVPSAEGNNTYSWPAPAFETSRARIRIEGWSAGLTTRYADDGSRMNFTIGALTPTMTPTFTITRTHTVSPTITPTYTITRTFTPTRTASPTSTDTKTVTPTRTATGTKTQTPTFTITRTMTDSPTASSTRTITPTYTITRTVTLTFTGTFTRTQSATFTETRTYTPTRTQTITRTHTVSQTFTRTPTETGTYTYTNSPTVTQSPTESVTFTITPVETATFTETNTVYFTATFTATTTVSMTAVNTATPTGSLTPVDSMTHTPEPTHTQIITATSSATPSNTQSATPSLTSTLTPAASYTHTATLTVTYTTVINTPTYTQTPVPEGNTPEITDLISYPNPLSAALGLGLKTRLILNKECSSVRIRFYTSSFRLIRDILLADNAPAGSNEFEISAHHLLGLSKGAYYYIITADDVNGKTARSKTTVILLY